VIKVETRYEGTPAEIREYERLAGVGGPPHAPGEVADDGELALELARFLRRVSHRSLVSDWLSWALAVEVPVSDFAGPGPATHARRLITARIGRGGGGKELDYVRLYTEGYPATIAVLYRSGRLTLLLGPDAAEGRNHVHVRDVRDPHKVFVELSSNDAVEEAKEVFRRAVASRHGQ
jgi:hypothetical protein